MNARTLISDLFSRPDGPVTIAGWVETVRDQKKVQFVILRDESGVVQLVNPAVREKLHDAEQPADTELNAGADRSTGANASTPPDAPETSDPFARTHTISSLVHGTFVVVTGDLKHDERVKLGGIEVKVATIEPTTPTVEESPIAEDSHLDKRMDWRFLDLRHPKQNLIFRAQTTLEHAWRTWWIDNDFVEIHSPKLMASPSETSAELFSLDYFDRKAYLAQSPQLYKQMAQSAGFGRIFEISPVFRADPSFTSRHATEFISVDAEMSWIDSDDDVARMQEKLMVAGLSPVKEKHGDQIRDLFGVDIVVPTIPFPRIPLLEAKQIVAERGYVIPRDDDDMDPEGERQIAAYVKEKYGHEFVFLTDYPASIRPFYHMRNYETGLTKSYDLIWKGVEITTGAQREHRAEILERQAHEKGVNPLEITFYSDFFRYGAPPHGGFGMGLARVLMLMLNQASIREVTYLFRGPTRLHP